MDKKNSQLASDLTLSDELTKYLGDHLYGVYKKYVEKAKPHTKAFKHAAYIERVIITNKIKHFIIQENMQTVENFMKTNNIKFCKHCYGRGFKSYIFEPKHKDAEGKEVAEKPLVPNFCKCILDWVEPNLSNIVNKIVTYERDRRASESKPTGEPIAPAGDSTKKVPKQRKPKAPELLPVSNELDQPNKSPKRKVKEPAIGNTDDIPSPI